MRIAVIDVEKCKPTKCRKECQRFCPPQQQGSKVIEIVDIEDTGKKRAKVAESLCIGCGQCVKRCPFNAIVVVNLPTQLNEAPVFRYHENSFALFRFPVPIQSKILGLLGQNGIGKSTILKLLNRELNFTTMPKTPTLKALLAQTKVIKDQDLNWSNIKVKMLLPDVSPTVIKDWQLDHLLDRNFNDLSGGERQRVALAKTCSTSAPFLIFDEPSTYLDIKQRIMATRLIKQQAKTIVVVDHDIAMLDYLCDNVSLIYGQRSIYGITTPIQNTAEGINEYLSGYIKTDNMQFRAWALKWTEPRLTDEIALSPVLHYPTTQLNHGDQFNLTIEAGHLNRGQITVVLGENGTGKSTWLNWLSKFTTGVVLKPQLFDDNTQLVGQYLGVLDTNLARDLMLQELLDHPVNTLSGGERQRVELAKCLNTPADIYLLDEPSAGLDIESRFMVAKLLRRWVLDHHCSAVVIEHDLYLASYLADNIILSTGTSGKHGTISPPSGLASQLNVFLKAIDVTLRRDHNTHRPRINQYHSTKDIEQRQLDKWYE